MIPLQTLTLCYVLLGAVVALGLLVRSLRSRS